MKKRALTLMLGVAVVLSLAACGTSDDGGTGKEPDNASEVSEQVPEEQPPTEQVSEPSGGGDSGDGAQSVGSGDLGDYHVEIKGASLTKDYEGKSAIVITYAWTNNSDDTTSAMVSIGNKAFQDGVQLESAVIVGDDSYNAEASMKDVRPGTTIDVQCAYVLTSETSTVEFELTEWISFSDDMVSMNFDPAALA